MTPSARDRAIEVLTEAVRYWTGDPDRCDMEEREVEVAEHLVDALTARPDVLHALAGTPRPDPREEAALDGLSPRPVVEADLLRAGVALSRIVAEHDHPRRQELQDVADWLSGRHGDPGSGWPVRLPVAPGVAAEQPTAVCGDVTGPNGVGGECALPPGHSHVDHLDGIGGEWPVAEPPAPAAEPTGPHLVDAAAPAMRSLLRRVADQQFTADDAVDVLLDWPNRAAAPAAEPQTCGHHGPWPSDPSKGCIRAPGHAGRHEGRGGVGWTWPEVAAPAAGGTTPPNAAPDKRLEVAEKAAEWARTRLIDVLTTAGEDIAANTSLPEALDRAVAYIDPPAHASVPAHPGVARVLARCDEREAEARRTSSGYTFSFRHTLSPGIATSEVRALLAGGEQQ